MALIIFMTGKKIEGVAVNALVVILTFHVENAMYGLVLTKTETALVHTMDNSKRIIVLSHFILFSLVTRIVF